MHHHKIGETNEPSMYRITDNAVSNSGYLYDIFFLPHAFFSLGNDLFSQCQGVVFSKTRMLAIGIHCCICCTPFDDQNLCPELIFFLVCLQRYSLEIVEWNGKEWQPYQADDVQLQFYMMSPYVLKTLSHDGQVLISFPW